MWSDPNTYRKYTYRIANFYNKRIDNATLHVRLNSLAIYMSHQHLPTTCYVEDGLVTMW